MEENTYPGIEKVRVLVIDDDDDVRFSCHGLLKQYVKKVEAIASPDKIISSVKKFHIVFLDMNYIGDKRDGREGIFWLQQILMEKPFLPVVMMTNYGSIELAVKAIKHGAFNFITKPLTQSKLLECIGDMLKQGVNSDDSEGSNLADLEKATIMKALEENKKNITRAARQLGISRYALYRKIKKYQL